MTLKGARDADLRKEEDIYPKEITFNPILRAKENSNGKKASSVLLTILKNLKIGTELTGMSSPILLDRGLSTLELNADGRKPTESLFKFFEESDPLLRALHFTRHLLVNFVGFVSLRLERTKPFNPILGEQFFTYWEDPTDDEAKFECILEQVSHHPPVTAYYIRNKKWNYENYGCHRSSVVFKGNSIELKNVGPSIVAHTNPSTLVREEYTVDGITAEGVGIIFGAAAFGLTSKSIIECKQTGAHVELKFSKQHHVKGKIKLPDPNNPKKMIKHYRFSGDLLKVIELEDMATKKKTPWVELSKLNYFHKIMRKVADQEDLESRKVWHNVRYGILKDDDTLASEQKHIIEEHQRDLRKQREKDSTIFTPKYFTETDQSDVKKYPDFRINSEGLKKIDSYFATLEVDDDDLD